MMQLRPYHQLRGNYPGKLLVLDSAGGVGKTTQVRELCKRIGEAGFSVAEAALPRYEAGPYGQLIKEYLGRRLGETNDIHYKLASVLYAVDRMEFTREVLPKLEAGINIVTGRYVASNMAYQGAKIDDPVELEEYLNWLTNLEYHHNGILVEDLVIVQTAPASVTQAMADARQATGGEGKDGHESSDAHVQKIANLYQELAGHYANWHLVDCHDKVGNTLKPVEETANDIWAIVEPILRAA